MAMTNIDLLNDSIRKRRYKETLIRIIETEDLNIQGYLGFLPLVEASGMRPSNRMDITKIIGYLVKNGADVNAKDAHGWTPLMNAAATNCIVNIAILVQFGADLDIQDHEGRTALMLAAGWGKLQAAKTLVNYGADVGIRDFSGELAWQHAYQGGSNRCMNFLSQETLYHFSGLA